MGYATTYSSLIHLKFSRLIYHTSKQSSASTHACISPAKANRAYSIGLSIASAFKNGEWLRVAGELAPDDRREARQSMLDAYPSLQKMYSADDGNTEVFYFKNATATFSSFTHEPEVEKF